MSAVEAPFRRSLARLQIPVVHDDDDDADAGRAAERLASDWSSVHDTTSWLAD